MTLIRTDATFAAPIVESRKWVENLALPDDLPLINVSQAAPVDPPPPALREYMARIAVEDDSVHLYGPVLGQPELREELAAQISGIYGGSVQAGQVAITSGCNQAFAAAIMALTGEGDEVLLPTPWYFNHKMCLDMAGVAAIPLPTGADLLPDPEAAERALTPRSRAIVLVSPNNPGGVEYPPALLAAFRDLARRRGIRLILDETYRDFHSQEGAPHALFTDPDWDDTLIHLYSFSKAYRLTGHRVGALAGSPALMEGVEKWLDTITICPNQIGQHAALWGMQNLGDWLSGERAEILDRRAAIQEGFPVLAEQGWTLRGAGAYFAYVEHPFDAPAADLARRMVQEAGILLLPGSMFMPDDDPAGARAFRVAFANINRAGIATLYDRLKSLPF